MNVKKIFDNLSEIKTNDKNKFSTAKPIEGRKHRIGKNFIGEFCLLFKIKQNLSTYPSHSFNNFEVQHNLKCNIEENNKSEQINFSIIILKTDDENLSNRFYELSSLLLEVVEDEVTIENLNKYIADLQNIFSSKPIASQNQIIGLIGELIIIDLADNTDLIIDKWRNKEKDKYDFLHNSNTLEVKATESSNREHNFSFEQLVNPPFNSFIASVLVKSKIPGMKLFKFIQNIEKKISRKDLLFKFKKNIFIDINIEENNYSFDLGYSKHNVLFYKSIDIPRIDVQPKNVTMIKFKSNLSGAEPTDIKLEDILN